LLSLEYSDGIDCLCSCLSGHQATYRCLDCYTSKPCCSVCMVETHRSLPFHRIEFWNGLHFERAALDAIGLRIYLGHDGVICPGVSAEGKTVEVHEVKLSIAHLNGIHTLHVVPCWCRGPRQAKQDMVEQLIRARLFPATLSNPTTAYTIELLEHWHLESLQSKKSTWDYWQALCQKSAKGVDRVRVSGRYTAFLRAGRQWRVLKMLIRSGQAHAIDKHLPTNRWPGSVVVVCPACPEPEFNLQENWEELLSNPEHRYKFILWHGTDGMFKTYLKVKRRDKDDDSLLSGQAFFPTREDWEKYCADHSEIEQNGPCPSYDKMHKIHNMNDREVSGLSAVCCIRHSIFAARGMVDLKLGEKY
ncbi:hypothetical protein EXIGLDRAFT_583392, partial [Exidia glandulosa HHB12029]